MGVSVGTINLYVVGVVARAKIWDPIQIRKVTYSVSPDLIVLAVYMAPDPWLLIHERVKIAT